MIRTSLALAALLAFGATEAAAQQRTVTWRFGHVFSVPKTLFDDVAMKEYPERLARASKGMIKVEVLQGVVNPNNMFEALADNRIQMGSVVTAAVSATHPRWHVLGLPGVLDGDHQFPKIGREIVWPNADAEMRRRWGGTIVAMGAFSGTYFFSRTGSGPVDSVAKMKGLKYRTHSFEVSKLIEGLGGAPVGLPFPELYSSLERRLVDAYTSATSAVMGSGLYEVTAFAEDWPTGTGLWFYVVSENALKALPEDIRKAVVDELAAIQSNMPERQLAETARSVEELKAKGMKFVTVPDAEKQRAVDLARQTVWPNWIERAGPDGRKLLNDALAALGKKL